MILQTWQNYNQDQTKNYLQLNDEVYGYLRPLWLDDDLDEKLNDDLYVRRRLRGPEFWPRSPLIQTTLTAFLARVVLSRLYSDFFKFIFIGIFTPGSRRAQYFLNGKDEFITCLLFMISLNIWISISNELPTLTVQISVKPEPYSALDKPQKHTLTGRTSGRSFTYL